MKNFKPILFIGALLFLFMHVQCDKDALDPDLSIENELMKSSNAKSSDGESAGNNLSFPVIWTDGPSLTLRGERWLAPITNGAFYYVWGEDPIDPQAPLYSCLPSLTDPSVCEDGSVPGGGDPYWKAFVQKDPLNEWQAFNYNGGNDPLWEIDAIDWGDNLESVDWTLNSQVRTEVVLYEAIPEWVEFEPGTDPFQNEYAMRHAFGWGITEVHGLQTTPTDVLVPPAEGNPATVYTPNARLTIQKINVESLDQLPANDQLLWDSTQGWVDPSDGLFNPPLFNMAVHEGGDGPGYYNAEVNVKGKVIFGYTWNVKRMNEDIGYYRITFSFDGLGPVDLNTEINGTTEIIRPLEEVLAAIALEDEGGDTGGAWPEIDPINKLTYIDVFIRKNRGAGGGNGGGKDNNPGGGDGGGKDGNKGKGSGSGSGSGSGGSGNGNH